MLIQEKIFSNGNFDPFVDLMIGQNAKPEQWETIDLRFLSPFQRALLAIDGTVTKFIESYMLEPIEILRLAQQDKVLHCEHPWLTTASGTPVIARQVLLQGKYSNKVYAYAVSLLMPGRLPATIMQGLDVEPAGLGRILLNSQLENRREILWYGKEQIDDLPAEIQAHTGIHFLSRTYRIVMDEKPIML
ncbi:MAG: chorismate pyruvate-lyase family protein, partial [Chloroflexota bacterium]